MRYVPTSSHRISPRKPISDAARLALGCSALLLTWALALACRAGTERHVGIESPKADLDRLSALNRGPGHKVRVVSTTAMVGDVVANIGTETIDQAVLVPGGTDPHVYQLSPKDLRAVAEAHVVFANGLGLEGPLLQSLIDNAAGNWGLVEVSSGAKYLELGPGSVDPHTWFDPHNVILWVRNIEQALSRLNPAAASDYRRNATLYTEQLRQLDGWIIAQVAQVPAHRRKLVTDHLVLGYFAARYGFEQIGAVIPGYSTMAQPSAREMADLEEAVRRHGVAAVFVGASADPRLAERLASDTGVKLVRIYADSLSEAGPASTYLDYIHFNVSQIVSALRENT
jgi:ABC-type Zn uptake system ZnuABC Zn-binding protein ZnuA